MFEPDQERWLTYGEAGRLLGIPAEPVRQPTRRQGWPRRARNAYRDQARVLIPVEVRNPAVTSVQPGYVWRLEVDRDRADSTEMNGNDRPAVRVVAAYDVVRIVEAAVAPLREALEHERQRAAQAERRAERAQRRANELWRIL